MYAIPLFIILSIIISLIKGINPLDSFLDGVKDGFNILTRIYPSILSMIFACGILIESNCLGFLQNIKILPYELLVQGLIKPLSGSGATSIMINIFKKYGVDSKEGIASSILDSTSETTFYVMSLYFSSVGVKKYRYALFAGLLADLIGFIITIIIFKIFL